MNKFLGNRFTDNFTSYQEYTRKLDDLEIYKAWDVLSKDDQKRKRLQKFYFSLLQKSKTKILKNQALVAFRERKSSEKLDLEKLNKKKLFFKKPLKKLKIIKELTDLNYYSSNFFSTKTYKIARLKGFNGFIERVFDYKAIIPRSISRKYYLKSIARPHQKFKSL